MNVLCYWLCSEHSVLHVHAYLLQDLPEFQRGAEGHTHTAPIGLIQAKHKSVVMVFSLRDTDGIIPALSQCLEVRVSFGDTCFMVSRMTAGELMEKALQGLRLGEAGTSRRGKLRLYAHWMTEASWKEPGQYDKKGNLCLVGSSKWLECFR